MLDETTLARIESQLIALRGAMDIERLAQNERWQKIEPVILARSGELERMRTFERDLNHLGQKHRALDDRVDSVEAGQRQMKAWIAGAVAAGVALGQGILWVLTQIGLVR